MAVSILSPYEILSLDVTTERFGPKVEKVRIIPQERKSENHVEERVSLTR